MKVFLFYIVMFLLVGFGAYFLFVNPKGAGGVINHSTVDVANMTAEDLEQIMIGDWDVEMEVSNEVRKYTLNGELSLNSDSTAAFYYNVNGWSNEFLEFGKKLTGGGSIKGRWFTYKSADFFAWGCPFPDQKCDYASSVDRFYGGVDLCHWLQNDIQLAFGNINGELGKKRFVELSGDKIVVEEKRFSEEGERIFTFTKKANHQ